MTEIANNIQKDLLDKIESIPDKQIITPTIPIAIYLQESENLAAWAMDDLDQLSKVGINITHIEDLKERIEACRLLQTEWMNIKSCTSDAKIKWQKDSEAGYALHKEILHDFNFAFRNDKNLTGIVKRIKLSHGYASLVQNLATFAQIGENNKELLEQIHFNFNKLEQALHLSETLFYVRNGYRSSKDKKHKQKVLRDKSYTYLKLLLDEIRLSGKYVFSNNKERLQGYKVNYFIQKRASQKE
ncbi:hypothetical protein [Marinifilum sp. D714]|uniref:hypothetical protein n=1 Tax=Marinifilum sp. D714 TaxID=2937523 RepID=UPI0027CD3187|nr:hypothetical protein [Marinifilum sp. D714]MDQ2179169.1 hypothetical protein [Marinifilum sp. D714]